MTDHSDDERDEPLLTQRAALILMMAMFVGVIAGCLTYWANHALPGAVLAGCSAFGVVIPMLHQLVK